MWPAGWTAEKGRAEHRNHMVSPSPTVPCTPASPREALGWGQYGLELTTAPVRHTLHSQPQRPTPGLATPEPRSRRSWVGRGHSSWAMTMSSGRGTEGSRVHLQCEPSDLQPAVTGGRLSRLLTGHWHRRGTSPRGPTTPFLRAPAEPPTVAQLCPLQRLPSGWDQAHPASGHQEPPHVPSPPLPDWPRVKFGTRIRLSAPAPRWQPLASNKGWTTDLERSQVPPSTASAGGLGLCPRSMSPTGGIMKVSLWVSHLRLHSKSSSHHPGHRGLADGSTSSQAVFFIPKPGIG